MKSVNETPSALSHIDKLSDDNVADRAAEDT